MTLKSGVTLWGNITSEAGNAITLKQGNEERQIPKSEVAETKSGEFVVPPSWKRLVLYWTKGISYKYLVAPFDGLKALASLFIGHSLVTSAWTLVIPLLLATLSTLL